MPLRGRKKPPRLSVQFSEGETTNRQASFKLTDTGSFLATSGKHGSFKISINAAGGMASPLAKQEFPGLTLSQIEPLDELGAGAGGTVRLARHKPTGRLLALKIMHLTTTREQRHMFLNELRILCKLYHPNLVSMCACTASEPTTSRRFSLALPVMLVCAMAVQTIASSSTVSRTSRSST